ncbi:MAG TPA: PDZ domain-containing protein, partial [Blastocatellia bacterium]|nr:PDZ domain-containing protein [Blastocatellia bacterium]
GNIGIGFAIPANMARSVAEQLIKNGKVRRGYLGVGVQTVTSDIAANLGLKEVRGVIVSIVERGSPAERAGLKQGDVITVINGNQIENDNNLRNVVASAGPGAEVTITILRDGREQQLRATLEELANQGATRPTGGPGGGQSDEERIGWTVTPMTPELAARLGLNRDTRGLVITGVDPAGAAAEAGLQPGDVIEQVNRQAVRSAEDLKSALSRAGSQPLLLLINRRGSSAYVTVRRDR